MSFNIPYNEQQLLLQIAAGDERAFSAFIYKHTDSIYSYILKFTKSEQWAEELVQDVWVQMWHSRAIFSQLEYPVAYLHRIAKNKSLDWLRKNKEELKVQYLLQQHILEPNNNPIAEKTDLENTKTFLLKIIQELPPQRKRIFELKQEGHSYDQIASLLQISKNTVRNQMVSALATLRQQLLQSGHSFSILLFFFF